MKLYGPALVLRGLVAYDDQQIDEALKWWGKAQDRAADDLSRCLAAFREARVSQDKGEVAMEKGFDIDAAAKAAAEAAETAEKVARRFSAKQAPQAAAAAKALADRYF